MINQEKYKTTEEREKAFDAFCNQHNASCEGCPLFGTGARCEYAWLELEAEENDEEKKQLLPCPFCGKDAAEVIWDANGHWDDDGYYISCRECKSHGPKCLTRNSAIRTWNRRKK